MLGIVRAAHRYEGGNMKRRITSDGLIDERILTKAEVIEALRTEPLLAGTWINHYVTKPRSDGTNVCAVCAVGALLRKALVSDRMIARRAEWLVGLNYSSILSYLGDRSMTVEELLIRLDKAVMPLLEKENFFDALSRYFETLSEYHLQIPNRELREHLVRFVEKNFPEELIMRLEHIE